ncbi:MAG: peptidoglycan recognition family protein [Cyanobacteriota bacterium]|nr:peptidoglycan recognition family protein [Cyanobacteriota bacterium]
MKPLRPAIRSLLLTAAALALVGCGWLLASRQEAGSRSGDLLGQLFAQDLQGTLRRATEPGVKAPLPPEQAAWRSPLQRSCSPTADVALRDRLLQQLQRLQAARTTVAIDPSNYGERSRRDAYGNTLDPTPRLVVLHETVYGIGSAINTFMTPHPNDADQVSYHALIGLDGAVVQVLDPLRRAFGSGNSAFDGEWVITNPAFSGSVNNFSLHVSLETPLDGEDADVAHSGYTQAQYDALAVLLTNWMRRFRIPHERITTHAHVDLGGERSDPRSFDWSALQLRLQTLGMLCR